MKRSIDWDKHGHMYISEDPYILVRMFSRLSPQDARNVYMALSRLVEYEDTGLSPREVLKMRRKQRARNCGSCREFDTRGYQKVAQNMSELQCGYCGSWRRDTPACNYCCHWRIGKGHRR